jgi:hypothetical protein
MGSLGLGPIRMLRRAEPPAELFHRRPVGGGRDTCSAIGPFDTAPRASNRIGRAVPPPAGPKYSWPRQITPEREGAGSTPDREAKTSTA